MALTLVDRFKFSKLNTIVFHGGYSDSVNTNTYTCTVNCKKDLVNLPAEIALIDQITAIIIEFCPQLDFAATFTLLAKLPFLGKLYIRNCRLKELSPEIQLLKSLVVLDLGNSISWGPENNELVTLPSEIAYLKRLSELNLGNITSFKSLPPEIAKLEKLKEINLRSLNSLPENIHLIPNLKALNLVDSSISVNALIPLVSKPNGLASVHVSSGYNAFLKLKEYKPEFYVSTQSQGGTGEY